MAKKKIILTNKVCLTLSAVTFPYVAIFYIAGYRLLGFLVGPIALAYFLLIYLNGLRWYNFSRLCLITLFNLAIYFYSNSIGPDAGIQLLYFAVVCFPAVLFESKQKVYILYGSILSVVGILVTEFNLFGHWTDLLLAKPILLNIRAFLIPTTLGILISTIFYFVLENEAAEKELKKNIGILSDLNKALKVSQAHCIESSKMAALGQMAGGIAHEINSPLAAIRSLCSQIQEVIDDDPLDKSLVKDLALKSEKTTMRIEKIILSLRYFSRDTRGEPFQIVNITKWIEEQHKKKKKDG